MDHGIFKIIAGKKFDNIFISHQGNLDGSTAFRFTAYSHTVRHLTALEVLEMFHLFYVTLCSVNYENVHETSELDLLYKLVCS